MQCCTGRNHHASSIRTKIIEFHDCLPYHWYDTLTHRDSCLRSTTAASELISYASSDRKGSPCFDVPCILTVDVEYSMLND